MKPAKSLLAVLAILGIASAASATTVVHLTGSTAYRGPTCKAILHSFTTGTIYVAANGADPTGASNSYFRGTIGTEDTIFECAWGGSVGGVYTLTHGVALPHFADNQSTDAGIHTETAPLTGAIAITLTNGNGLYSTPSGNVTTSEVTMTDTFQNSTPFTSPQLNNVTITSDSSVGIVGIVPFTWVKGKTSVAAASNLTNMNPNLVQAVYGGLGKLSLALFTGSAADESTFVYGAGRDPDSGTRLTAFAEGGLGSNAFVQQWQPSVGTTYDHTQIVLVPGANVPNLGNQFVATGNNGYAGGGSLANALKQVFSDGVLIGYVGTGDATPAIAGGASALSWNGVFLTDDAAGTASPTYQFDRIREGKYTFWGYEQMLYSSAATAAQITAANTIATQIHDVDAQILLSTMRVGRLSDGSLITPNF